MGDTSARPWMVCWTFLLKGTYIATLGYNVEISSDKAVTAASGSRRKSLLYALDFEWTDSPFSALLRNYLRRGKMGSRSLELIRRSPL